MSSPRAHLDTKPLHSDDSDEDAPGVGDYTVYECPGLAPVSQVLFSPAPMDSSRLTSVARDALSSVMMLYEQS